MTIHARTQTSRSASISTFGIDIARDLLKVLTGQPTNENFGSVITGRDSVHFTYELDIGDIGNLCDYLYEKYLSHDYKNDFEWFDNLQMITDPSLLSHLNNNLLDMINTRNENAFYLAPPEVIEWMNVGGFSFTERGPMETDLLVDKLFEQLNERNLDSNGLKRRYIYVKDNEGASVIYKWKLYDCIVFETEYNDELYILTVGIWFKVDRNFVNSVNDFLRTIREANLSLPSCGNREYEEDYNDRVGKECDHIITLDRKTVYLDGSPIEICDLLTNRGQFIHVKPWKSSSTLSHLFAQGRVSAISILQDNEFRKCVREIIKEVNPHFVELINEANMDPSEVEIVFAIIDSDKRPLDERLPFFSKLNFMHTVKLLRAMRFNVTKYKIVREV